MKKFAALLFVIFGVLPAAFASSPEYQETYSRCSAAHAQAGHSFRSEVEVVWHSFSFQTYRESASEGLMIVGMNPEAIGQIVADRGLSPHLATLLQSEGYQQALQDCYGHNVALKHAYTAALVASDVAGKATVIAGAVAVGFVTGRVIMALYSVAPKLTAAISIVSSGYAVYSVYKAMKDLTREATPAERQAAENVVNAINKPIQAKAADTEVLLKNKVDVLIVQLNKSQGPENVRLTEKLQTLMNDIDEMEIIRNGKV